MRIAFIKQKFVPFGGGEGYLERLMRGFRDAGHDVHLITGEWGEGDLTGITLHRVPVARRSRAARVRSFSRAAARCADEHRFDVTFGLDRTERQDVWRAGEGVHRVWLARRRLYEPRWKTWLSERSAGQRALVDLEAAAVRNARLIIANSHLVARDLRATHPDVHAAIEVIHNGIDLDRFTVRGRAENRARIRREWCVDADRPLLLFVGSGFRRKGLAELLEAMRGVPECALGVLGRDRTAPWRALARRFGVAERVFFPGPRRDIASAYHAGDAVVLPTWFDAFPNVGIEAMACGTPFITSQYAGVAEVVQPGVNGSVISSPAATDELAEAIRCALAGRDDPERAERISVSVREFSIEDHLRRTLTLIENL